MATCINVEGLTFEAISDSHFLISRDGRNIETMQMNYYRKAKKRKIFVFLPLKFVLTEQNAKS